MTVARRAHYEKVLIKSSRRHFRKAESKSSNGLFLSTALKTGKKQVLRKPELLWYTKSKVLVGRKRSKKEKFMEKLPSQYLLVQI